MRSCTYNPPHPQLLSDIKDDCINQAEYFASTFNNTDDTIKQLKNMPAQQLKNMLTLEDQVARCIGFSPPSFSSVTYSDFIKVPYPSLLQPHAINYSKKRAQPTLLVSCLFLHMSN